MSSSKSFPLSASKHDLFHLVAYPDQISHLDRRPFAFAFPFLSETGLYDTTSIEMNVNLQYSTTHLFRKPFYQRLSVDVLLKDFKLEPSMLSSVSTVNSCFSAADPNPPFIAECSLDLRCSSHNFSALILLLSPQLITNQSIHRAHLMSSFFCAALGADLCWLDSQVP